MTSGTWKENIEGKMEKREERRGEERRGDNLT
jgi:hypothetical protein